MLKLKMTSRSLLKPILVGVFIFGILVGIVQAVSCFTLGKGILQDYSIFGLTLFPDGVPDDVSKSFAAMTSLVFIPVASAIYGVMVWAIVRIGIWVFCLLPGCRIEYE